MKRPALAVILLILLVLPALCRQDRPGVKVFQPPTAKCEQAKCEHDTDDLRFVDCRVTDLRSCEFSFEGRRRTGVLQLANNFSVITQSGPTSWTEPRALKKGDAGTVLYCSTCNTALAMKAFRG